VSTSGLFYLGITLTGFNLAVVDPREPYRQYLEDNKKRMAVIEQAYPDAFESIPEWKLLNQQNRYYEHEIRQAEEDMKRMMF
jgi:hypothetical protein